MLYCTPFGSELQALGREKNIRDRYIITPCVHENGTADASGKPGETLEPREIAVSAPFGKAIHRATGADADGNEARGKTVGRRGNGHRIEAGERDDGAADSPIGDKEVRASAQHGNGHALGGKESHDRDELLDAHRLDEDVRGTADPEGRMLAHRLVEARSRGETWETCRYIAIFPQFTYIDHCEITI